MDIKSIYLCPMTNKCGAFSNKVLSPKSGRQPKAMAIDYIVLDISRKPLISNLGKYFASGIGFLIWQTMGEAKSPV